MRWFIGDKARTKRTAAFFLVLIVVLSMLCEVALGSAYEKLYGRKDKPGKNTAGGTKADTKVETETPASKQTKPSALHEEMELRGWKEAATEAAREKWEILLNSDKKWVKQLLMLVVAIALGRSIFVKSHSTPSLERKDAPIEVLEEEETLKRSEEKQTSKEKKGKEKIKENPTKKEKPKEKGKEADKEDVAEEEYNMQQDGLSQSKEEEEEKAQQRPEEEEKDRTSSSGEQEKEHEEEREEREEIWSEGDDPRTPENLDKSQEVQRSSAKEKEDIKETKKKKSSKKLNDGQSRELVPKMSNHKSNSGRIEIDYDKKIAIIQGRGTYGLDDPALDTILRIEEHNRKEKTTKIKSRYHRTIVKKEEQQEKNLIAMDEWKRFLSMSILNVSLMIIWWSLYVIDYLPDHFFNLVWEKVNNFFFSSLQVPKAATSPSMFASFVSETIYERVVESLQPLVVPILSLIVVVIVVVLVVAIHMFLLSYLGGVLFAVDCCIAFFLLRESFIRMFIYGAIGLCCHHTLAYYRSAPKLLRRVVLRYSRRKRKSDPDVYIHTKAWALSLIVSVVTSWLVARGDLINPYSAPSYFDRVIYLVLS